MNIKNRKVSENPMRNSVGLSIFLPMNEIKIPIQKKTVMNIHLLAMMNLSRTPIENNGQAPFE